MMIHIKNIAVLALIALTSISCSKQSSTKIDENIGNIIKVSKQQFETVNMKLGNPLTHTFKDIVRTNGYIIPSPAGSFEIVTLQSGRVADVRFSVGEYVSANTQLFTITGNEVISVQQEYVKSISNYELSKQELERVKTLVGENISAKKNLAIAENKHRVALAEKQSYEAKLHLLDLNPQKIAQGYIYSKITVKTPISGFITEMNIMNGQFIEPQITAAKIIDTNKLQLELNVFCKDARVLKPGQKIEFYNPDRKTEVFSATLRFIGKAINNETKTISCIASIDSIKSSNFISHMYAESSIITNTHTGLSLPIEAIFEEEGRYYILVKESESTDGISFIKVEVEVGISDSEYIEIKTKEINDVLISGVYYLVNNE